MNDKKPGMFYESGVIEANEANAYSFLEACLNQEISLTGQEPSFQDVLDGFAEWCPQATHSGRFKEGNGNKFVNALSDMCGKQRTLFGLPNTPRLRDFGSVNTWLTNLCNAEAKEKEQ